MNELPSVNPYAVPQAPVGGAADAARVQYKPLAGRAVAVMIPMGLFCVFSLLAIVLGVGLGSSAQTLNEAWQDETPVTRSDLLEFGEGLAAVATIITLCFFLPQANRNSRALTGEELRFTPASTIWWFFVPFLNLVRPYQAVREIWRASTARPQEAWFAKPAPPWLRLWWGTWLAFNVLSRITEAVGRRAVRSGEGLSSAETVALLARITGIVAAACLIYAVWRIASTQAKRFSAG